MIDSQQVLATVQNGQAAPTWNVLPAKKSFFVSNFISYIVIIIACIGLIFYLLLDPNVAIVPKFSSDSLDSAALAMWRTIDMIIIPIAIVGLIWLNVTILQEMKQRQQQVLVMLPEGVVVRKGKTTKFITFSQVRDIKFSRNGLATGVLILTMQNGAKVNFSIDRRFGSPIKLLKQIAEAHKQYKITNGLA